MEPDRLPADLFELRDWVVDAYRDAATALRRSLETWDEYDATVDRLECIFEILRAGDPADHAEEVRKERKKVAEGKAAAANTLQDIEELAGEIASWKWSADETRHAAQTLAQSLRKARDNTQRTKNARNATIRDLAALDQYVADLENLARS